MLLYVLWRTRGLVLMFGPHGSQTRSPVDERQARALEAPSHACAVTVGRGRPAYDTDRPRQ